MADTDSRARTHLANERTFLAWLRTGLSLMALGLAAASFLPLDLVPGFPFVRLFAILLICSGAVMVAFGGTRYQRASRQIDGGSYQPGVRPIAAVAFIVVLLGVASIPLVLLLR